MKKETIERLIKEISNMEGVDCVMRKGDMLLVEPRGPIFINSLGEEFYNLEGKVFYFDKKTMDLTSFVPAEINAEYMGENEFYSEIYKTEETALIQRDKYKESLKPIYRAFKLDEADEYLGLKLKSKEGEQRRIIDNVMNQNCLNHFFDKCTKLDGSPVGKIEE